MAVYKKIRELLRSGRRTALVTVLRGGGDPSLAGKKMLVSEGSLLYSELPDECSEQVLAAAGSVLNSGQSSVLETDLPCGKSAEKAELFIQVYNPSPRLVIFGGGHVGAALVRMAAQLDYEIVLVDDRPSFASERTHPAADRLICAPFDRALEQLDSTPADYLVIVTRGHQHDRMCLEKALQGDAAYIGMIGSRKRVKAQLDAMAAAGFPEERLNAVHSPIGLPIGAVTEAEIAVSILAEITRVRRQVSRGEVFRDEVLLELDRAEENNLRAVLATIIRTHGSAPRKTGSQMIIFPGGSTKGTVGGGCAEAEVRTEALNCFDSGHSALIRLNLTADAAADEGMACGGIMDIFLEMLPGE